MIHFNILILTFPDIAQASTAMKRITSLRSPDSENSDPSSVSALTIVDENEKGIKGPKVEFKNVWFKYPSRDVFVLRGLNITVSFS